MDISSLIKGAFAVGTTEKICGRSLSSKIPVDMNSIFVYTFNALMGPMIWK